MASAEPAAGPVSVIVLAAGRGERFIASGGRMHKLDAPLAGRPVLAHVLETVRRAGFEPQLVRPPGGTSGMGESIAMGVRATPDAAGWLILPGDLPLVGPRRSPRWPPGWPGMPSSCRRSRAGRGIRSVSPVAASPRWRRLLGMPERKPWSRRTAAPGRARAAGS